MNKSLLLLCIYCFINLSTASSQTAASASWALNDGTAGRQAVVAGAITGSNQALGGLSDATYSTSTGPSGFTVGGGWQRLTSTSTYTATSTATPPVTSPSIPYVTGGIPDYTHFAEYKVTATAGNYFKVTNFQISALGGGTGNARLVVLYSLDGFNSAGLVMPVSAVYYSSATSANANYAATEAQPVVLLNTSTQLTDGTNPNGREILSFSGLNILLSPEQTLSIRIYPFLAVASTTSPRYFISQKASITGLTASNPTVLPLDFLSFNAKLTDGISKQVKLSWSTANEVNTQSFSIERKTSSGFATIGSIASNNTAGANNYSFTDIAPASGVNYYRIKQIDKDGKSSDSKVAQVENKGSLILSVYPNPTSQTSVSVNHNIGGDNATLKVLSLQGLVAVTQPVVKGSSKTVLDISSLASGYYAVVFENGSEKSTVKLLKQ